MKWKQLYFKAFIELQRGYDLTKSHMRDGNYPVVGSNSIIGYHCEYKHDGPGVITGRSGSLGEVQYIGGPYWPHNTSLWVKDFKGNIPKFVYYKLMTLNLQKYNAGGAVPTLNRNNLDNIEIAIPPVSEQMKIAYILSTYDDLIETNLQRIALLEEAARLLYQEWFVHFRFPGHEYTKMVDGIPEGWLFKPLCELALITMGQSPKSEFYNELGEGLPFHQGVSNYGQRFVSHKYYCTSLNRIAESGDILFSVRAPVGRLNFTLEKIVIGRGLASLQSKTGQQTFFYYQLKNHFFKENLIGTGAIYESVTKKELENQCMLTPVEHLVVLFEDLCKPIDSQLETLYSQNQKLKQARDLLLPKLMSGEVMV